MVGPPTDHPPFQLDQSPGPARLGIRVRASRKTGDDGGFDSAHGNLLDTDWRCAVLDRRYTLERILDDWDSL